MSFLRFCRPRLLIGSADLPSNTYGYVGSGGLPFAYDLFIETKAGVRLLNFPGSRGTGKAAAQRQPVLRQPAPARRARRPQGQDPPPPVFQPGSSYVHLDEATYLRDNRNALMTPALGQAETIRDLGPITLAIFRPLG